jgi:hypothetical protein
MAKPDMWVHYQPQILKCGRTAHMEEELPDDAPEELTAEILMARKIASDAYEPRLKAVSRDGGVKVGEGSKQTPWIVRHMGEQDNFLSSQDGKKSVNFGVVVARSLQWPGSYSFYQPGQVLQVYVGSGQKYEEKTYFPEYPPDVNSDPEEFEDQPEPTPLASPPPEPAEGEEGGNGEEEEPAE